MGEAVDDAADEDEETCVSLMSVSKNSRQGGGANRRPGGVEGQHECGRDLDQGAGIQVVYVVAGDDQIRVGVDQVEE